MQVLKKITVKAVLGDKPEPFSNDTKVGTTRNLITVIGRVDKMQEGNHTMPNGDESTYIKFRGAFAAFKGGLKEGTEFRSGVCILPSVAGDYLAGSLVGEEVRSVDFGFSIGIKKTATTVGYEYYCEPLLQEAEDTDPLVAIGKKVQEAQKALAAPAKGKAA